MALEVITTKEFLERNKKLHLMHVKHGYLKGQRPKVSKTKRKRVYKRDKGICAYYGSHVSFDDFDIDHIVPLAKGGNN